MYEFKNAQEVKTYATGVHRVSPCILFYFKRRVDTKTEDFDRTKRGYPRLVQYYDVKNKTSSMFSTVTDAKVTDTKITVG